MAYDERKLAVEAAINECRDKPIDDVAEKLGLAMDEKSGWMSGPCPVCGGEDRFNINVDDGGFFCRKGCEAKGSGPIDLVMVVKRKKFLEAVGWLFGDLPERADPEEQKRQKAEREKRKREKAQKKERYRNYAIRDVRTIWMKAQGRDMAPVKAYLALRGIKEHTLPGTPACLRFLPDHAYVVSRKIDGKKELVTMHRGPAMIAAIQGPDGRLTCVHQTWIDLDQEQGKPQIVWNGEKQRNKLTRGSQLHAAIRLVTPERYSTIVMAEGIETTLTAAIAWRDLLGPETAYWAGISLGHMAGRMKRVPGKRYSGIPDMEESEGFYPPPWVTRLIYIQDGDSDPTSTRAKLQCGLRRAMALNPGLRGQIVHAGEGVDLNDVLVGKSSKKEGSDD